MRWRVWLALGAMAVSTGCSQVSLPVGIVDAREAPFDECNPPYVFAQETTLEAIGLGDLDDGAGASRRGMVWITADSITEAEFAPPGAPMPFGQERFGPVLCIEYDDGSGMSTILDDGWHPAGGGALAEVSVPADLAGPIVAAVIGLLLVAVSFLAFRRRADEVPPAHDSRQ